MTGSKKPPEDNDDQTERLTAAVRDLAGQIEVLRNVLDEIRADFRHAIFNDKLRCANHEAREGEVESLPGRSESELDEQHDRIAAAVEDSLRDVANDLEETVRDQLRQELTGFRDSIDQFSIDIQWAVRQVRHASSNHRAEPGECPTEQATKDDAGPTPHPPTEPEPTNQAFRHNSRDDAQQSLLWQSQ